MILLKEADRVRPPQRASTPPNAHSQQFRTFRGEEKRGKCLWSRRPASYPVLTGERSPCIEKRGTLQGQKRSRLSAFQERGRTVPSTSLYLDSGTGQSPSAQISSRHKEPSTPERSTLGGRGTPPRGRRQLLVGRGSSPPPQGNRQGVGGVPPSPGGTSFSPSPSPSSLRSSPSGDPVPLPSLGCSAKYGKSHRG